MYSPIAEINTGTVKATPVQNRRCMCLSSEFSSSPAETVRGSRAIPQMGQFPGSVRTISGCMGQTYSVRGARGALLTGSSVIPHLGQLPGPF